MTEQEIRNLIKQNLTIFTIKEQETKAQIAIETLLTTGLLDIKTLIALKTKIYKNARKIKDKINV